MNKRHYEHTLPNIRGSLSNTYDVLDRRTKEQKNKSHKVKYVLLFFCLKIVPRQNYQVICLSRPNAVHLQRM